jgi:hypothetical protein
MDRHDAIDPPLQKKINARPGVSNLHGHLAIFLSIAASEAMRWSR